jgi:hypothetical protein
MLEITAALTMILWTLGLFSGSALGAAVYVLPIVALTALGLRVYESLRGRAHEKAASPGPEVAPARSAQPAVQSRSATEHARAA